MLQVHHIVFRSQGGLDTEENLITLCGAHHDNAHNKGGGYLAPWELQVLVRFPTNLNRFRHFARHLRDAFSWGRSHEFLSFLSCLSCEWRTEQSWCQLWEHFVDWDYVCEDWKERDSHLLPDCQSVRKRRVGFLPDVWACAQCSAVVNLHVKDEP
jgi:hypothetical protein